VDIYLVRSSMTAAAADETQTPEAHRFLSLEGRQVIRAAGNKLRLTEEPAIDRFVTSPLAAAVQTAELFADRTDYVGLIEVLPGLGGNTPASVIVQILLERGTSIVVVADEPLLATIGAFLVGRPTFPPSVHGQVSLIQDRKPAWCHKPGEHGRSLLLVA
jgi:phosphohistidine phosphatase SixA